MQQDIPRRHAAQRKATTLLAVLVLALGILAPSAQPARAFPVFDIAAWPTTIWTFVKNQAKDAWNKSLKSAADVAFKNALKVYMTNIAEQTAIMLTSWGTGEKPLWETDKHWWSKLNDAAAGDFLDTLSTKTIGIDVCAPENPQQQFALESVVRALVNPQNWCQSLCKSENEKANTSDTFVVGKDLFISVHGQPAAGINVTLPQAQASVAKLQALAKNNQTSCGGDNLYDVDSCPGSIIGGFDRTCGVDAAGMSLGACLDAYTADIATYQRTLNSKNSTCNNLCSAQVRKGRCTAAQTLDNLNLSKEKSRDIVISLNTFYNPEQNDLGKILLLQDRADQQKSLAQQAASAAYQGIKGITDKVTGNVTTPSTETTEAAKQLAQDPSGKIFSIQTGSPLADTIGVFTQTLTNQVMKMFQKGLVSSTTTFNIGAGRARKVTAAEAIHAQLAQSDFKTGGTSVALAELTSCPPTDTMGPNNCILDEGFRQAIEQQLTIQEAIDAHLLDPAKPFGYLHVNHSDPNGTTEPATPDEGYSYRSMLVLRRLRILPVGWEIAAQWIRDNGERPYTLHDVLTAFTTCSDAQGASPSPFCGLVDPNWVLKLPQTYCKVNGATAAIATEDQTGGTDGAPTRTITRTEACVDEKTCIQEDENGNCTSYGYCVQERPSWKFGGDQCINYNQSCQTFVDGGQQSFSYLQNTLNYQGCTQENSGCQWYCQTQSDGVFTCQDGVGTANGAKSYLTATTKTCTQQEDGCRAFLTTDNGSNLLPNGSFETLGIGDVADDGKPDSIPGWSATDLSVQAVADANLGSVAGQLDGTASGLFTGSYTVGRSPAGQTYTLSFAGKADAACSGTFGLRTKQKDGSTVLSTQPVTYTTGWQTFATTVTFDPGIEYDVTDPIHVDALFTVNGCAAKVDSVQLEEGEVVTSYKEYGSDNTIALNKNRIQCSAQDVGCDLYTSSTDQIPGITTTTDGCPAAMAGCQAFQEVPITDNGATADNATRTGLRCSKDQSVSCKNDNDCSGIGNCLPSVSLVPSTGQQCSAAAVGCEEYTNLDVVAQGGEGKEYYSYIRPCSKPGSDPEHEKTFYTWVGSDQTGFQLLAYALTSTTTPYTDAGDTVSGGPAYINDASDSALTPDVKCNAAIYNDPNNTHWTPDCRQFQDALLNTYYRLYSRTVAVSDDCHPLRNTIDSTVYNAIPSQGTTCFASEVQCREYHGPASGNTRVIYKQNFDSGVISDWSGGTPSSQSITFGGGSLQAGATSVQTTVDAGISDQLSKDKTYLVTFWAAAGTEADNSKTVTASLANSNAADELQFGSATLVWDTSNAAPLWKQYTLGPVVLNRDPKTGTDGDQLRFSSDGSSFYLDTVTLTEATDSLFLIKNTYQLCGGFEGCAQYSNREGKQFYLKSFSRLCSESMVGCKAVIDTQNSSSPFETTFANGADAYGDVPKTVPADVTTFVVDDPTKACPVEHKGCTAFGQPQLGPAGSTCSNDPTHKCTTSDDCGGAPATCDAHDVTIEQYTPAYLVDNPDDYSTALCLPKDVGCDTWTAADTNQISYFHRPDPRLCEYKTVTINGVDFPGWYKVGTSGLGSSDACPSINPSFYGTCKDSGVRCQTDTDCGGAAQSCQFGPVTPVAPYTQPSGVCKNDATVRCAVDTDCGATGGTCVYWGGVCDQQQSGCREYRDTQDPGIRVCSNDSTKRCESDANCGTGATCQSLGCYPQCLYSIDTAGNPVAVDGVCNVIASDKPGKCAIAVGTRCGKDTDCTNGDKTSADFCIIKYGCRGYNYLAPTVADSKNACSDVVDEELGCHAFYTPNANLYTQ